jgi:hypothetical protein
MSPKPVRAASIFKIIFLPLSLIKSVIRLNVDGYFLFPVSDLLVNNICLNCTRFHAGLTVGKTSPFMTCHQPACRSSGNNSE